MTETKHTPGPWVIDDASLLFDGSTSHGPEIHICSDVAEAVIARIGGDVQDPQSNARLIAAAPDLLAALEAGIGFYPVPSEQRTAALAAIAKARGKP